MAFMLVLRARAHTHPKKKTRIENFLESLPEIGKTPCAYVFAVSKNSGTQRSLEIQ